MDVTVITVSMPSRARLLREAVASVSGQTLPPATHLVRVAEPVGEPNPCQLAIEVNRLLEQVATEWVAAIEDDDIWYPDHLAAVAAETETADVVYTFGHGAAHVNMNGWAPETVTAQIRNANVIPYCAAIRTELLTEVGGWGGPFDWDRRVFTQTGAWAPDWDLWIRVTERHPRIRCVPRVTWEYRQGPQSITNTWHH